jgi:hypothetical protein
MHSLVRAIAWAPLPTWACRLGARRPVGPGVKGACLWEWQLLGGMGFWSCGTSLLLAENYNRTTTNNTTEAQSAQRLNSGGRNSLRLDDSCGLWGSLARAAHRPLCNLGRGLRLVLQDPTPVWPASRSVGQAFLRGNARTI